MLRRSTWTVALTLLVVACLAAQEKRAATGSRCMLSIDGAPVGVLRSFAGGAIYADVVASQTGSGQVDKRPGPARYEDIVVELPVNSQPAQQLINSMWGGKGTAHNGSVVIADYNGNIASEIRFANAIVSEVTVPACDGASKDARYFTVKLTPEQITTVKPGGKAAQPPAAADSKMSPASAFRLQIDGMDCSRVRRIEPLSVKLPLVNQDVGALREPQKQTGALQFSNLRFSLPEAFAQPFQQWLEQSVIQGKAQEKNGSLVLLSADMKTELAVINFFNLGIVRVARAPIQSNADQIVEAVVELYCERMELAGPGGAQKAASAQPPAQPPAQEQPAPGASPTLRQRSGELAQRQPLARPPAAEVPAATQPTAFRIQPNAKLAPGVGRLVVRFPEGTERREYQRIQFPKDLQDTSAAIEWGSLAKELPPGEYIVALNGKRVQGVKVEGGSDTALLVGTLRVKAPEGVFYEIVEEDLDSAPAITQESGTKDIALPAGSYFIRVNNQILPFAVEDGKITEFAPPEAR